MKLNLIEQVIEANKNLKKGVKEFGEVTTPISLVEEMLDTLPKEVWLDPNKTWLDPCAGTGIFPAAIVTRLMKTLVEFEPDENKRYKHIMENMIYVYELQGKNVIIYKSIFDRNNELNLNIINGSFLD